MSIKLDTADRFNEKYYIRDFPYFTYVCELFTKVEEAAAFVVY